jgi:uncharacterized protein YcbK (DUF882 family)
MATVTTTRKRLSPHFVIEEFDGHDAQRSHVPQAAVPAVKELCVHLLEPLREKFGPCTVTSGYRTKRHNDSIPGSAKNSQHIYTNTPGSVAVDVRFASGSVAQWTAAAKSIFDNKPHWTAGHRGGVGDNPAQGIVHLDSASRRDFHES